MSLKEMVMNNKQVEFIKFDNEQLWYKTESGFEFPVPVSDTGAASFMPKDKAILFMRWIKKQLDAGNHVDSLSNNEIILNTEEKVSFIRYQQGDLWYINDSGFEFPISVKDNSKAIFNKTESSAKLSNWIKLHLENIEKGRLE